MACGRRGLAVALRTGPVAAAQQLNRDKDGTEQKKRDREKTGAQVEVEEANEKHSQSRNSQAPTGFLQHSNVPVEMPALVFFSCCNQRRHSGSSEVVAVRVVVHSC